MVMRRSQDRSQRRSSAPGSGRWKALCLAATLAVPSAPAAAQDVVPASPVGPEFQVDIITFSTEQTTAQTLVEVYVSVAHDQLAFTRAGEVFRADYDLQLRLIGPRGEMVFDETTAGSGTTPIYEETLAEDIFRLQRFTFVVRPGAYTLEVAMTDRLLDRSYQQTFEVEVPRFLNSALGVSDILLTDFMGASSPDLPPGTVIDNAGTQLFTRKGHAFIPNTRGIYANFVPSLLAYYEIYGLNPLRQSETDRFYKMEFYVNTSSDETVLYYMRQHEKPGASSYNSVEMNIQDLRPGDYALNITVTDLGTGTSVTRTKPFKVLESYLTLAYRDYDKAVRQLRYISTERELRALRDAPEEERLRIFRNFWISRDPTPGTKRNEALVEYYRRIEYANEQFRVQNMEGWATDRGMVYITLGLPDLVERAEFDRYGSKPRELWVYNSMRLQLIFDDETGFGDFILQNRQEFLERTRWGR